jgi:hypothetical protein
MHRKLHGDAVPTVALFAGNFNSKVMLLRGEIELPSGTARLRLARYLAGVARKFGPCKAWRVVK